MVSVQSMFPEEKLNRLSFIWKDALLAKAYRNVTKDWSLNWELNDMKTGWIQKWRIRNCICRGKSGWSEIDISATKIMIKLKFIKRKFHFPTGSSCLLVKWRRKHGRGGDRRGSASRDRILRPFFGSRIWSGSKRVRLTHLRMLHGHLLQYWHFARWPIW